MHEDLQFVIAAGAGRRRHAARAFAALLVDVVKLAEEQGPSAVCSGDSAARRER